MTEPGGPTSNELERQIGRWRDYLRRRRAVRDVDVEELEDHLRGQIDTLVAGGLSDDEAFLVAVKRMGELDDVSREFAREHSERLWKQLVQPGADTASSRIGDDRRAVAVVLAFAAAAAVAVKLPALFGIPMEEENAPFYLRNASLFVLPLLTAYLAWKRTLATSSWLALAGAFASSALVVNVYPLAPQGATLVLAALHLPIALWLAVGIAYAGGRWSSGAGRMDFVRFTGELFIYYVLIALGGGVLTGFTMGMFASIDLQVEWLAQQWLLPCGAVGAVLVGAWLVEAKQSVVENMAPVLTRLFTPLFAVVLLVFLATMAITGRGINVEREVLIAFDLLLVLVLGLLLYSVSARDPQAPPGLFDALQLLLVVSALLVDGLALMAIASRISEFGFSANKVAALGENVILLINLGWSAVLYGRFMWGQGSFAQVERWQTNYLPVYAVWAAFVVVLFPPLFGFQ